jgi:hypothetical protein
MFVGFKPKPICQERVCNSQRKKCRKKTHRQWAYLLGRKLLRRRKSTSLQRRWFHVVDVIILLLNDSGTLAFSLPLRSNGYRQTSSFGNKGFFFLRLQLSTPEAQQPSPCFLWVNYLVTCLQQCAPHYSLVNVRHRFAKLLQTSFTIFSPKWCSLDENACGIQVFLGIWLKININLNTSNLLVFNDK